MSKITVVIADDIKETRDNIKTLLSFDNDIRVIGEAENGEEAVKICEELYPDVILLDINMPIMDGIKAAKEISLLAQKISIIMISVQGEIEYLKKAMASGAKGYLIKPFNTDDLIDSIKEAYDSEKEKNKIIKKEKEVNTRYISVFSTKGGTGKTTVATNLAVSLSRMNEQRVLIFDLDLQFGDVALFLNKNPQKTIIDMLEDGGEIDYSLVREYIIRHSSGIDILSAPKRPEQSEYITLDVIRKILESVNKQYDYVIMDTTTGFTDTTLLALDYSDIILYVSTLELSSIKNLKLGFGVLKSLEYPDDKIKLIINKANEQYGIKYNDVVTTMDREVDMWIPEDTKTVVTSINKGAPFVLGRGNLKITRKIKQINTLITGEGSNPKGIFLKKLLG